MANPLKISVAIPTYQAADTIDDTLRSIYKPAVPLPDDWTLEVLVVDDDTPDREALMAVLEGYPCVKVLRHEINRGLVAARNTGLMGSTGDLVTVLDADDRLVDEWPKVFAEILAEWPPEVNVCYSACVNPFGRITATEPGYRGLLTFEDMLNERHPGEYLPFFRGPYIRQRGYVDLNTRKEVGLLSYLTMAQDGPFWITPKVLRVYFEQRPGSLTATWTHPDRARDSARGYEVVFERFEKAYRELAPRRYWSKRLRYAVYLRLAGDRRAWSAWLDAAHPSRLVESLGALLILMLGRRFCVWITRVAKSLGMIRQYG